MSTKLNDFQYTNIKKEKYFLKNKIYLKMSKKIWCCDQQ